jgi:hypothetical protein
MFYFSINAGSVISTALTPELRGKFTICQAAAQLRAFEWIFVKNLRFTRTDSGLKHFMIMKV